MAFNEHLARWNLEPDGESLSSPYSHLLPVRYGDTPAMLKVATAPEERAGANLMAWWDGKGAAAVFEHNGDALLMERATGERSLTELAKAGADDAATRVICEVAARLHQPRQKSLPALVTLERWFEELWPVAAQYGGLLGTGAEIAHRLLREQRKPVVLHGDLHHGNVLDFGERGWLVIDPKGLYGERAFDYVNLLRNPDAEVALAPGRFEKQVTGIVAAAKLDRRRFLEWTLAFTCLSAAWILGDGDEPELDVAVARKAAAALGIEH